MSGYGLFGDLGARIADAGRSISLIGRGAREPLGDLCSALLAGRGEATGLALAREILERFERLDTPGRLAFFSEAVERFGVDEAALAEAAKRWRDGAPGGARALHHASEPRTQELFRRLNRAPGGTRALVAMRRALLEMLPESPELAALDADFRHLLASWFNRGFLELRSIDWDTPASILERIIRYEAVHEIKGWGDLRRRVAAPDRRLYAFFHPALRDDPLIFVEVALTRGMPAAIGPILAEKREALASDAVDTAVFYSISNCQPGLKGISFGSFLIKQVAEDLAREIGTLRRFATLSPLPGLRRWATAEAARSDGLLTAAERAAVAALEKGEALDPPPSLAARYLAEARHAQGGALDPVARFHLGNGARLERINIGADESPEARARAWGAMVNYLYDLDDIERNHEAYAERGEIVAASSVRRALKR